MQTLLAKYPQGVGSLDTDKKNPGNGTSFFVGSGAPPKMAQGGPGAQPNPMEMQRMQKILADAEKNPADALASAVTLSDPRMKTQTLVSIARSNGKKNISVAHSALTKATESASQLDGDASMMSMRDIASVYFMLDEKDDAKKIIEKGITAAEKIYKIDINADNPNLAPKPYWPSTAGYRGMMMLAMKISPMFAQEQLKEISDPEIRTIVQIGLAQSLLNTPAGDTMVMSFTKESAKVMMMRDGDDDRK